MPGMGSSQHAIEGREFTSRPSFVARLKSSCEWLANPLENEVESFSQSRSTGSHPLHFLGPQFDLVAVDDALATDNGRDG